MTYKECSKCKVSKDTSEFHSASARKDGFQPQCKLCRSQYKQNTIRKKRWYEDHKELTIERSSCRYEENKEQLSEYRKNHYILNVERYKWQAKDYYRKTYEADPVGTKKRNADYVKHWRNKNPHIVAWRTVLRGSLERMGQRKQDHTIKLLGYSANDLKEHLENLWTSGMSWDNYGDWHIDHIKPVSCFDKTTLPSIVNALENLRPLWATTREIDGVIYEGNLNRKR